MALTPRSEFSNIPSGNNDIPGEIANTQADLLPNMPFVTDSTLNRYAIDPSQYPKTTKMLVGFMRGKRVRVTYYRQINNGGSNNRTNIADYATERDVLNSEFEKILNLEITLPKGFDFGFDTSSSSATLSGQAMFYPNMNPSVGDIFTTSIGDGKMGLFRINNVMPMSWRTDRIYTVDFSIQGAPDWSDMSPLERSVKRVLTFSKENYLGGTAALLSETTYLHIEKVKVVRSNLCRYYHSMFFSPDINSYLRPDRMYDPGAVQFMLNRCSILDIKIRPKLLTGQNQFLYDKTIWSRLDDRYNPTLLGISPQYVIKKYTEDRMGAFVTELARIPIIWPKTCCPTDITDPDAYYIFSANFYNGDVTAMSSFELLVYQSIISRSLPDLENLITAWLDPVGSLDPMTAFYRIPLYIYLIDISLQCSWREIDAPSMG